MSSVSIGVCVKPGTRGDEGTFWGDGNVPYLDLCGYICNNPSSYKFRTSRDTNASFLSPPLTYTSPQPLKEKAKSEVRMETLPLYLKGERNGGREEGKERKEGRRKEETEERKKGRTTHTIYRLFHNGSNGRY